MKKPCVLKLAVPELVKSKNPLFIKLAKEREEQKARGIPTGPFEDMVSNKDTAKK